MNIEILERVELEEILALYKEYKEDYEEVRALYLELKDKVDLVEGEELERDIRIIETHWVNVYELLIAAFAVVSWSCRSFIFVVQWFSFKLFSLVV